MAKMKFGLALFTWHLMSYFSIALELKFDLGESRKDCFYEEIDQIGENIDVVFHVLEGGRRDVTLEVLDPNKKLLAQKPRMPQASLKFKALTKGVYTFCFSNEFSSFTHKLVYVEISTNSERRELEQRAEEEQKIQAEANRVRFNSMTSLESSLNSIKDNMRRGSKGMKAFRKWDRVSEFHAKKLLNRVNFASAAIAIAVVVVGILQTCFLRGLFSEKKSKRTPATATSRRMIYT